MTPERLAEIRSRLDVDDLLAEVDRLLRWKSEATEVLNAWEKVWVAAGEPGRPGESKAKATAAEVDRLRDRLRAQVTAVESLAEKIEATADQDEEAAASIGTSAGQTRLQALADNGRWTVRELRAALASGDEVRP